MLLLVLTVYGRDALAFSEAVWFILGANFLHPQTEEALKRNLESATPLRIPWTRYIYRCFSQYPSDTG